jgi:hypothetical protein
VVADQEQEQERAVSSDQEAAAAAAEATLRKRRRPAWADDRPGCWLRGMGTVDFYVQQGDFVCISAAEAAAAGDPLAFMVSSSSMGKTGVAYVYLFRLVDVCREILTVSFFLNKQRNLTLPLQNQGYDVQLVARSSVTGRVLHVLEPESPGEMLLQLDAAVVTAVLGVLSGQGY